MMKKIKFLMTIIMIVFIIYYVLDFIGVSFSNAKMFEAFYKEFDYPNITNNKFEYEISKFFNSDNIINYSYGNLFYEGIKKNNIQDKSLDNNFIDKNVNADIDNKKNDKTVSTINDNNNTNPIVYIYNTHNKEAYAKVGGLSHNITPNVVTVSYMLKEQLEKLGINSIVEERKASDVLDKNKWNYASSYKVTKQFLIDTKKKNQTLKFFIDVHRDSVKKNISTINIKGKNYAKIMFVLGLENVNYKNNLVMMEYLHNNIAKEYPGLSRGIYKKKGKGVNGVYNQDFSKNCILIEFGGNENTLEEVYNTTLIVSKYLSLYIGDNSENG